MKKYLFKGYKEAVLNPTVIEQLGGFIILKADNKLYIVECDSIEQLETFKI